MIRPDVVWAFVSTAAGRAGPIYDPGLQGVSSKGIEDATALGPMPRAGICQGSGSAPPGQTRPRVACINSV